MIGLLFWTIDVLPFIIIVSFGCAGLLFVTWLIMQILPENAYPAD